jgi:Cu+-exporting ATPase
MVAVGRGARAGVLVRDAEALETLEKVDTVVVDKTGTLTEGRPRLAALEAAGPWSDEEVLAAAAGLEKASEHPLAAAIVAGADSRGLALPRVEDFESFTGKGVVGRTGGKTVAVGNDSLMRDLAIDISAGLRTTATAMAEDGKSVVMVAIDGLEAGLVAVADPVRPTTADALAKLAEEGVRVVMLTGDRREAAWALARELGISEVEAEVSPADKADVVMRLRSQGRTVAMAGDGINDAPALASADVGMAMGTGTDVAQESASVVLVGSDLGAIARARRLSRISMRNIRQNLAFAFAYNSLGVPVAAGLLYPLMGILLNPMLASAAMSLSSVSVIANALRLRRAAL